ncbi:unnamed protein product [Ceratitis capitata]|uniref:(Mediterranean fruit fly) hypothetical protein n=1 Tax=Ceratitis capitata TaxID=7213 RepID=A0A811TYA2_CERCA|nr:unnamed protein product [Ceratitis capitata]
MKKSQIPQAIHQRIELMDFMNANAESICQRDCFCGCQRKHKQKDKEPRSKSRQNYKLGSSQKSAWQPQNENWLIVDELPNGSTRADKFGGGLMDDGKVFSCTQRRIFNQ